MARAAVEALLWLLEEGFAASEHALLRNLDPVKDGEWAALPAGGERSIASIVAHVGQCKCMYENHAFGDRSLRWDEGVVAVPAARNEVMAWLRKGQERLVASIEALEDADLRYPADDELGRGAAGSRNRLDDDRARYLPRGRGEPHPLATLRP